MSINAKPTVRDSSSDSDGAAASKPQVAPASPAASTLAPSPRDSRARRWALFSGPRSDARRERYRHEVLDVADGARAAKRLDGEKGALPDGAPSAEAESTGLGRTMGWKGCAWNSCAYSIALGILSLPSVCATLGIAPFVILACVFAALTYYTGMSYHRLQQRYPGIHSLEDAGDLLFGRVGAFVLGWTQVIFSVFLQGNHVLLGAKAFNALGWRAPQTCAIALYVVFAIISFLFSLPRSYKLFSWLAVFSVCSILVSVLIVLIASGVTGPADGTVVQPIRAAAQPGFLDACLAITNLFVSFGSSPSYLPLMAEMRDPKGGFPRALKTLVIFQLVLYCVVGCVVYRNLGPDVASPSIAALQPIYQKAAYGTGLGTILLAGCESAQVSAKVLYVKLFRMRPSLFKTKAWGWGIWTGLNVVTWTLAAILAMILPFFSSFLGVEASAFWSAFLAAAAAFSVYCALEERSHGEISAARCTVMLVLAAAVLCVTTFIAITGMWASAVSIRDSYAQGIVGRPFSCAITDA